MEELIEEQSFLKNLECGSVRHVIEARSQKYFDRQEIRNVIRES